MRFKIHSVKPCIYKRDYSTGGNIGSLIYVEKYLVAGPLSLSLCLFICMSLCLFVSLSLCLWRGGELKCYRHTYIQTYRHTDIQTYRPSDEAGPRGAFAPKITRI